MSKSDNKKVSDEMKKRIKKENKEEEFADNETNKKVIILVVIGVILVLGLIIGGVIYFNSKDDKKSNGKDSTKKKEIVKGKTLKVKENDDTYIAVLDDKAPIVSISGEKYQAKTINAKISASDNESLETVEYGFTTSNTKAPSYTKVNVNSKKYSKGVSHTVGNNYTVTYLWVRATDSDGNQTVKKKEFITAQYINTIPEAVKQVSGDVIINSPGTVINNITVNGSIYITKKVGLGNVTLNNVVVKKNIYVNGGGTNSINLNNIKVGKTIDVNNKNHVRLNFTNQVNKIKLNLVTDTTLQTDGVSGANIEVTVKGNIKVLVDGNIKKMNVQGNANIIEREDGKEVNEKSTIDTVNLSSTSSKAVVDTYVKNTNYNVDKYKNARVQPLATLEIVVKNDGVASSQSNLVSTELTINREINVEENLSVSDDAIKVLVALLKNGKYTQAQLQQAVKAVGKNDIIVIISYKVDGDETQSISSAQRGEIKEVGAAAPTDGKYEKGKTYTNDSQPIANTVEKVETTVVVIEKENAYIKEEEEDNVVNRPQLD